jgi:hypothetical protein
MAFDFLPAVSQQMFLMDITLRDRGISRRARLPEIDEAR